MPARSDACAEPGTGTVVGGESVDAGVAAAAPAPGDEDGVVCEDRFAECEVRAGEGACDEALVGALDAGRMARACPLSCNSCGSAGPPLAGNIQVSLGKGEMPTALMLRALAGVVRLEKCLRRRGLTSTSIRTPNCVKTCSG